MELTLTESESKYYNDLFSLCDVEKVGKVPKIKSNEFFRSAEELDEIILAEVSLTKFSFKSYSIAKNLIWISKWRRLSLVLCVCKYNYLIIFVFSGRSTCFFLHFIFLCSGSLFSHT